MCSMKSKYKILEHHTHIFALVGNIDTSCQQQYGMEVWSHIQLFFPSFRALENCSVYSAVLDIDTY